MFEHTLSHSRAAAQDRLARMQRRLAGATLPAGESLPDDAYLRRMVWAPVTILLANLLLAVVCAFIPGAFALVIASEQGIVENITVVIAAYGAWLAVRVARAAPRTPFHWLKTWYALFAVGLLFIAGEETSWGQHWFFWATPEWIAMVNTQQETNLHNYNKLTENAPKLLLAAAVYGTGLAYPLWVLVRRPLGLIRNTPLTLIWPSAALWSSALIALLLRFAERAVAWTGGFHKDDSLFRGLREGLEIFLVLFLAVYLLDMLYRYRRMAHRA